MANDLTKHNFLDEFYLGDFLVEQFATGQVYRVVAVYKLESHWQDEKCIDETERVIITLIADSTPYTRVVRDPISVRTSREISDELTWVITKPRPEYLSYNVGQELKCDGFRILSHGYFKHRDFDEVRITAMKDLKEFRERWELHYAL